MLIRRRKKEDADDIVTRVGDYNNAAALNYEPRDIGPVPRITVFCSSFSL